MNDNKQPTNLNNTEVVNNDKREMKVENNNNLLDIWFYLL